MLEKVIENWTSRLDYIRAIRGSPMPEIIFKIAGWKYTRIYNPERRPRVLVIKCRIDSSQRDDASIVVEALGPVVPCLKMPLGVS
ncbi:hypothetical protein TNCV_2511331 [Trichonephila clavipes]|nr:hypothetical protein TNCV_2511331 [Trichonephila clavipes]